MNTNILSIDLNEDYKIKIDNTSNFSTSYFKDVYKKAAKATEDILKEGNNKEHNVKHDVNHFKRQGEEYNNIIAFCGERGTGKSSAMISFANSLININNDFDFYKEYSNISKYRYYNIEVIDPSMFEEKENIFEIVLAQLFSSFEEALDNNERRPNIEDKRKVLELFQKVYENLKTIQKNGDKYNGEALETLSKLSCGANLRNNFSKLINEYLNFIKPEKDDKACLIIPIDDFDLNIRSVAHMAEQIRKYLMIPNVIILLAADIKQLSDAKEQNVREEFKTLISDDAMSDSPKSITAKYILKLIPDQRRLELPYLQNKNQEIVLTKGEEEISNTNETIQDLFLRLCYENYHILFVKPKIGIHNIIPSNIRELKEWLLFLVESPSDKIKALQIFNDKFIINYCQRELENHEDLKLIELINKTPSSELHLWIIREVIALFNKENLAIDKEYKSLIGTDGDKDSANKDSKSEELKEFLAIIKRGNNPLNISLGDLLLFLDIISRYHRNDRFKKIIFSIKTIVSIRLKRGIINIGNVDLLKGDIDNSEFRHIVGGSIINTKGTELMTKGRTAFKFKYEDFSINDIKLNDIRTESHKDDENFSINIKVFECLHYFITIMGNNIPPYRLDSKDAYYNKTIGNNEYAEFDILAPFFNLSSPQTTYNRVFNIDENNTNEINKDSIITHVNNHNKYKEFPFESIELIDYIFDSFKCGFEKYNLIRTIRKAYQTIIKKFDQIRESHSYYEHSAKSFIKGSPILEMFYMESIGNKSYIKERNNKNKLLEGLLISMEEYIYIRFKKGKEKAAAAIAAEKTREKEKKEQENLLRELNKIIKDIDSKRIEFNLITEIIKKYKNNNKKLENLFENIKGYEELEVMNPSKEHFEFFKIAKERIQAFIEINKDE